MGLMFTSSDVEDATNEQLAQSILELVDGSLMGNSIAMTAAKELARRIRPDIELVAGVSQNPIYMDARGGQARPAAAEVRINKATYDILSASFKK